MRAKNSRFWGGFPSLDTLGISSIFYVGFKGLKALWDMGLNPFSESNFGIMDRRKKKKKLVYWGYLTSSTNRAL